MSFVLIFLFSFDLNGLDNFVLIIEYKKLKKLMNVKLVGLYRKK